MTFWQQRYAVSKRTEDYGLKYHRLPLEHPTKSGYHYNDEKSSVETATYEHESGDTASISRRKSPFYTHMWYKKPTSWEREGAQKDKFRDTSTGKIYHFNDVPEIKNDQYGIHHLQMANKLTSGEYETAPTNTHKSKKSWISLLTPSPVAKNDVDTHKDKFGKIWERQGDPRHNDPNPTWKHRSTPSALPDDNYWIRKESEGYKAYKGQPTTRWSKGDPVGSPRATLEGAHQDVHTRRESTS